MIRSALTIRLPDDTAERLRALARSRGQSVNTLIETLSAQALADRDTESHFRASATMGDPARALAVLDRLDAAESDATRPLD
jgi:predicted transcriptional regulator